MILTPRYGSPPVIVVDARVPGDEHPMVRQRRRLEALLGELDEADWQHPTRCDGWSSQDVITHLVTTNGFWSLSIRAGLAGEPTRFLGTFDPVATPALLVDQAQGTPPAATLEQFVAGNDDLASLVDTFGPDEWNTIAEAPPGHLPIGLVADHALWDGWVHERDIALPLGRPAVVDADEVLTSLRYAAALGRGFDTASGTTEAAPVVLEVRDPDAVIVVTLEDGVAHVGDGPAPEGALRAEGDAVEILEMLSVRDAGRPLPEAVATLMAGLATVFDQPTPV